MKFTVEELKRIVSNGPTRSCLGNTFISCFKNTIGVSNCCFLNKRDCKKELFLWAKKELKKIKFEKINEILK